MGLFDTLKREIQILMTEMDQYAGREKISNREAFDRDTLETTELSLREFTEKKIRTLYVEQQKNMINQELRERGHIEKSLATFFNVIGQSEKKFRESAAEGWADTKDTQLDGNAKDESDFIHLSPVKK